VTGGKAMSFLFSEGGMAKAARSIGSRSISDGSGIIEPGALPYHMSVVMIEPTVIAMNFDLGALIHDGEVRNGQVVGTPYVDGYLAYGPASLRRGHCRGFPQLPKWRQRR
jgi:hypothetical protein